MKSHCLECNWAVWDHLVTDRSAMMIEHAVATGHDIDSVCISSSQTDRGYMINICDGSTDKCVSSCQLASDARVLEWRPVSHRSFERVGDGDLSYEITAAIADAEGVAVTTITSPPLFEVVDVFALEEMFFGHPKGGISHDCTEQVQFRYRGFRVMVTSDGRIIVTEPVRDDVPSE